MVDFLILFLVIVLLLGPLLTSAFISASALCAGSYLLRATKSEMVFLRPASVVVFVMTLFFYVIGMCIGIDAPAFLSSSFWQAVVSHPRSLSLLMVATLLVAALYWTAVTLYRKKCALVLDLDRQTYKGIDGTVWMPKARTGPWSEIAGITVWKRSVPKNGDIYLVRLRWISRFQVYCDLGGFEKREKAEVFAEQMAWETGLPIVASPF